MSSDAAARWARTSRIVAEALDVAASDRPAFLTRECEGDAELRHEVEALLAAHDQAGAFLEQPIMADARAAAVVSEAVAQKDAFAANHQVGPYRIIRELGHGGMGVVYLGARADAAFDKQVAIKVVRAGVAPETALRRFREERRILATLEHANIARLLDAGATEQGLPYLVMEYVDGVPVDEFCRERRLSLNDRLQLFRQICAGVQYAHQRLIIHRDIKPRNILVTPDGTPKLLDFGIAKILEDDAEDHTQTALRAFTLENASPEQVRGEPMTATSDVYALGVLLFRLVTGQSPYGPGPFTDATLLRAVCDEPPLRPRALPRITGGAVSAELEWVVLKALRKEPERRYESVEQFSEDVRRLLEALPVLAAPDSRRYRVGKFVSRHRVAVVAAALIVLTIAGGLVATLWQARRAEEQRRLAETRLQETRRLANAMVFELNDALSRGATEARTVLLTRAAEQLDALASAAPGDPVLAEELAAAYHKLGNVFGETGAASVGNRAKGLEYHQKGLAIREAQMRSAPDDVDRRARYADSLMDITFASDEVEPSFKFANAAVEAATAVVARSSDINHVELLASAHYTLGSQYRAIGETDAAFASFSRAAPLFEQVFAARPDVSVRRQVALCQKRLGAILVDRSDFAAAMPHLRRAADLDSISLDEQPTVPARKRDLSVSNTQLGFALYKTGQFDEALLAFNRALALREQLLALDGTNQQASRDVAGALFYVAIGEVARKRPDAALPSIERALTFEGGFIRSDDDLRERLLVYQFYAYDDLRRFSTGLPKAHLGLAGFRRLLKGQPQNKTVRRNFVDAATAIGGRTLAAATRERAPSLRSEGCALFDEAQQSVALIGATETADQRRAAEIDAAVARCRQTPASDGQR